MMDDDVRRAPRSVEAMLDALRSTVDAAARMERALRLRAWRSVRTPAGRAARESALEAARRARRQESTPLDSGPVVLPRGREVGRPGGYRGRP